MQQEPITELIAAMKSGDEEAAARIWSLYRSRVAGMARKHLPSTANQEDVSDVVQSVFRSVLVRARQGLYEPTGDRIGIQNRGNLRAVLLRVAFCKAVRRAKKLQRQPMTAGEIESVVSGWSDHEVEADVRDVLERLKQWLRNSDNDGLRVLELRLGSAQTQKQIAETAGFSVAKVERKIRLIREKLLLELA